MITLSPGNPMRVVLMTVLIFEVIVYGLAVPVMIFISDVPGAAAGGFGGGQRCWPWWQPGCCGVRLAMFSAG